MFDKLLKEAFGNALRLITGPFESEYDDATSDHDESIL